ncbi:MAG: hypothetical protein GY869_26670, partial [Planctomycetes bacterium]|nr:hypothetical protein [Planctomycetota bacterium]
MDLHFYLLDKKNRPVGTEAFIPIDANGYSTEQGVGGGITNSFSSPTITNCIFIGNSAEDGGAICNLRSLPAVTKCIFSGNSAGDLGGAMNNWYSNPTVTNCTFSGNSANNCGGMANVHTSSPAVTNCIFWNNSGSQIYNSVDADPIVIYSNVQGGYIGTGNIEDDPMFVDPDGSDNLTGNSDDDLHLQIGSASIDSGDPSSDFSDEPDP